MPRVFKGVGQLTEGKKHEKSILYKPPKRPAEMSRQYKSAEGQAPLFEDVPIDHLQKKKKTKLGPRAEKTRGCRAKEEL